MKKDKIEIFITKTTKVRAKITPKDGVTYEVTIGGKNWNKEKLGQEYSEQIKLIIMSHISALMKALYTVNLIET